ncbi:MAG: thioesterase [Eubacteriales bacterium]|nr:thioesterase [Eubacteriales bacterium]
MPFEYVSKVRYSEVCEDHCLSVTNIVNYFQDCSTFQSEELGNGLELMETRNRAWILAHWHIILERRPMLGEEIHVQTWPTSMKGFMAERNYQMLDAEGKRLAYANTLWTYLDVTTGHPARIDQDVWDMYQTEPPIEMARSVRKIPVPEECELREDFAVRYRNLDTNHHVNNAQYIEMALEYLPSGSQVRQIRVEYRKAAKLHERILPLVKLEGDKCTVALCDLQQQPYAVLEMLISGREEK